MAKKAVVPPVTEQPPSVIALGERTETITSIGSRGNVVAGAKVRLKDGRVFISNSEGHAVIPAGIEYSIVE